MSFFTINDKSDYIAIAIKFQENIKEMCAARVFFFEKSYCEKLGMLLSVDPVKFFPASLIFFGELAGTIRPET